MILIASIEEILILPVANKKEQEYTYFNFYVTLHIYTAAEWQLTLT